jgi:hypothetical protein
VSEASKNVFSIELKHIQQSVLRASLASLFRFQRDVFWSVPEPWAVAGVIGSISLFRDFLKIGF